MLRVFFDFSEHPDGVTATIPDRIKLSSGTTTINGVPFYAHEFQPPNLTGEASFRAEVIYPNGEEYRVDGEVFYRDRHEVGSELVQNYHGTWEPLAAKDGYVYLQGGVDLGGSYDVRLYVPVPAYPALVNFWH